MRPPPLRVNLQRLDWLVKVARYGGISQAVRRLPHTIQQPALSEHMAELERELGTKLFVRQPFRLLEAGRELLRLAGPFFDELAPLVGRLRDRRGHLQISVTELVRTDGLARLIATLEAAHPGLRCTVGSERWPEVGDKLREGTVDLALTLRGEARLAGVSGRDLAELPLALLVPAGSALRDPEELWRNPPITERLICPGPAHAVAQAFGRGLALARMHWPVTIEVDSLGRLVDLVGTGGGVGVAVMAPWLIRRRDVRVLPLGGFAPVHLAVLWKNPAVAIVREAVEASVALLGESGPGFGDGKPGAIRTASRLGRRRGRDRSRTTSSGRERGPVAPTEIRRS